MNSRVDEAVDELFSLEIDTKKRNVLAMLLDEMSRKEGFLLAQRTQMGGTEAYLASVSFSWLAQNVGLARNLNMFDRFRKSNVDEDQPRKSVVDPIIVDADSVELFMQREIRWSRQRELAEYLIKNRVTKFPPILVVLTAPWVDDPDSDAWGADGRAIRGVADYVALDGRRSLGLLNIDDKSGFMLFALDGQHRLIGVKGALNLIRDGSLQVLKDDGKPAKEYLELDSLVEQANRDRNEIMQVPAETIGMEIIPAVIAGETYEEALRRVRSIFVHVNKQAAPLSQGEIAMLEEDDGFAIVARKVAMSHPLLGGRSADRVNMENSTIAQRSAALTTLQTLKDMSKQYLGSMDQYASWKVKGRLLPVRPSSEQLSQGIQDFNELWNRIGNLPSLMEIQRGKSTADMRRFAHEKNPGDGHMLFRPIGQIALARAVSALVKRGKSLDQIFAKLDQLDRQGGFKLDDPANVWYGVLYDPSGQRMRIAGRDTAADLLAYLVMGEPDDALREDLTERFRDARLIDGNQDLYRGFDGNPIERMKLDLPPSL